MGTKSEIEAILARAESVQLVGLSGMGKSHVLRKMDAIFIDATILFPIDYMSLLSNFAHSLKIDNKVETPIALQHLISDKIGENKTVIIIDGFEKIVKPEFHQFFDFLKSLRDMHKSTLSYVFCVSGIKEIDKDENNILGNLFRLVQENIVYMKPVQKADFNEYVKLNYSTLVNEDTDYDQLYNLSGGIPSLIKALLKKSDLLIISQVQEIKNQIAKATIETLTKHGLVDENGEFISQLLNKQSKKDQELTTLESILLKLLKDNIDQVVTKEQICDVVYSDVKNKDGISDNSIDQLIHRLRKKVKDFGISSIHGRGYKLHHI